MLLKLLEFNYLRICDGLTTYNGSLVLSRTYTAITGIDQRPSATQIKHLSSRIKHALVKDTPSLNRKSRIHI